MLTEKSLINSLAALSKFLLQVRKLVQTPEEKLSLIEQSFPNDIDASIEACEQYLIYADDNDLPLMLRYYQAKRHTMFRLLRQIEIKSTSKDMLVERLVKFILAYQRSHGEKIKISPEEFNHFEWLDDQWFQFVTGCKTRRSINHIKVVNQQNLELAVFKLAMDEINCADSFVLNSYENDDPNKQFISWDEFYHKLKPYTEMIGKNENARQFIKELKEEHQQAAEKVNRNFVDNEYLNIIDGEPVLKRTIGKKVSQQQEKFANLIASKMPLTDIISVITDVENWLGISHYLKPISGYEPKIDDYDLRFFCLWL